jgi:hypothetical protein
LTLVAMIEFPAQQSFNALEKKCSKGRQHKPQTSITYLRPQSAQQPCPLHRSPVPSPSPSKNTCAWSEHPQNPIQPGYAIYTGPAPVLPAPILLLYKTECCALLVGKELVSSEFDSFGFVGSFPMGGVEMYFSAFQNLV